MNVLFLSLGRYWSIYESEGYTDLLRIFLKNGDKVFLVSPTERREGKNTQLIEEGNAVILKVKTGNIQKTNFIEKGISTIMIESQFLHAIKKYFSNIKFDLVLYPTPPITLVKVVEYIKKRDMAKTYLLLKDIFPQNALDLGILQNTGPKSVLYYYFRNKEKKLYKISDTIGCMSPANVQYILKHNPEIDSRKVEVCPNVIEIVDKGLDHNSKKEIREKYGLPLDKKILVYGGNLGRPQGIEYLIQCIREMRGVKDYFFLVVGDGTEYEKLEKFYKDGANENFKLIKRIPKTDYDAVVASCDIGLIFLDHRFTIPNFPSRLLGYLQARLPVLACTDPNTDIGKIITIGNFGWWCESNNVNLFSNILDEVKNIDIGQYGERAFKFLNDNYSAECGYRIIMTRIGGL